MASWAEIHNGLVRRIVSIGLSSEELELQFLTDSIGGTWVKSSTEYAPRSAFAVVGYSLGEDGESFIPPKLYDSWVWDEALWLWQPSTPRPESSSQYIWNEQLASWIEVI